RNCVCCNPIGNDGRPLAITKSITDEGETRMSPEWRQIRAGHVNGSGELCVCEKCIGVLEGTKHRPWRPVGVVVCKAVEDAQIIVLVPVGSGRKEPHKRLNSGCVVIDQTARYVLRLDRFI